MTSTVTATTFTPTPLCQDWCVEHEVFESDDLQSPHIFHWGTSADVDCSNGMTVHLQLTKYEGGAGPRSPRERPTALAIDSWPTVAGTHPGDLDDIGIPLSDARVVAIALEALAATAEAT